MKNKCKTQRNKQKQQQKKTKPKQKHERVNIYNLWARKVFKTGFSVQKVHNTFWRDLKQKFK